MQQFSNLHLIGIDRDQSAIKIAQSNLAPFIDRVSITHTTYDQIQLALDNAGVSKVDGILFDLGVSSMQLDQTERGFSFRKDGPLDMRMDQRSELSAANVVNEYEEAELAQIISRNADERFARRIAKAIVSARPINTTTHLAEVIVTAIPAPARRTGGHPAKRTFQAIRIEVNKELEILERALQAAINATAPAGRVAVLTYHSGENRIVKRVFAESERDETVTKAASPFVHESQNSDRLTQRVRAAKYPSSKEQTINRRAKSARLRVLEKTLVGAGN